MTPAAVHRVKSPTVHIGVRSIDLVNPRGGLERAAGEHVFMLGDLGKMVCVHTVPGHRDRSTAAAFRDVSWPVPFAGPGRPGFGIFYALWSVLLARSIDKCWQDGDFAHFHGAASFALTRVKNEQIVRRSVANPHGMEEFETGTFWQESNRRFVRAMSRRGAQLASRVISTDNSMSDAVVRNLGVDRSKLVVIPNTVKSVRPEDLGASPTSAAAASIVTVGRVVHNKGYDSLARALRHLEACGAVGERVNWVHFGSGPDEEKLTEVMRGARSVSLQIVHGADDQTVMSALRSCRIFVQPSRYEGSSLTTLEAMAQGATVVATPVGGIPDKIFDGTTGVLAKDSSWESIAVAVERGLRERSGTLGRNARDLVAQRFSHASAVRKYGRLYADLDGAE